MNKKAIKIIILLMATALIGIVSLQINWIRSTIKLNEEQFDINVYSALSKVGDRLEYHEHLIAYNIISNGYVQSHYKQEFTTNPSIASIRFPYAIIDQSYDDINLNQSELINKILVNASEEMCMCSRCTAERVQNLSTFLDYREGMVKAPLQDRIRLDFLDNALNEELINRGIDVPYHYGVYDRSRQAYVLANNHIIAQNLKSQKNIENFNKLLTTPYRINIFSKTESGRAPGLLMLYFPSRSSVVLSSVWLPLLGTILFTGIILFCFIYVVNVVFLQKKLSEMKTDFINNMTHEFKTPIATISLAADSINSPLVARNPEKVQRFAGIIKQENRRMNHQVEKVLQIAALDKHDYSLNIAPVPIHDIINNAVENINLSVERKNGITTTELNAENDVLEVDQIHISNIINNLLDNANKYSPTKPEIYVSTMGLSKGIQIIIRDCGIGMSKEDLKNIFDKFYRVHTGDVHNVKGFGLGLSYVKTMIEAHHGSIKVKSEVNKGSQFTIFLPYLQPI